MTRVHPEVATIDSVRRSAYVDGIRQIRWRWLFSTASAWLLCLLLGCFFLVYLNRGVHGTDSHAYWATGHRANLYGATPGSRDAYLYSPAFATLIWPLAQLPWHAFLALWSVAEASTFAWLLAPLGWRWGGPLFCLCLGEVSVGNIYAFLAVVPVIGLRRPGAWALPLLTKITPGLGPIWFAARREWRALVWSISVPVGIAMVSFAVNPGGWSAWFRFLADNAGGSQFVLPLRFAVAIALVAYAAARRWTWVVPIAMLLANPMVLHSEMSLSLLAALPRLVLIRRSKSNDLHGRRGRASDTIGA